MNDFYQLREYYIHRQLYLEKIMKDNPFMPDTASVRAAHWEIEQFLAFITEILTKED